MVRAQDSLVVGEGAFEQGDGLACPPGRLVGQGEVVAGCQGVWVVGAEDPLVVGEGAFEQRDSSSGLPGGLVGHCEAVAGSLSYGDDGSPGPAHDR